MRNFSELSERELLALAIANEEEDGRIYTDIAEGLRDDYAASAEMFHDVPCPGALGFRSSSRSISRRREFISVGVGRNVREELS